MSCNCVCDDKKSPATGWNRLMPLIVVAVMSGVIISGAALRRDYAGMAASRFPSEGKAAAKP